MNDRLAVPHADETLQPEEQQSLLEPGRNCMQVAKAPRAAFLVDAEDYFRTFHLVAQSAQHSIIILGWDFNSRTRLHCDPADKSCAPCELGPFLNFLVKKRRGLNIYILDWDYPMIFGTDREFPPVYGLGWRARRRVHLRYDNTHPVGGSHHQKIVVIDDALAFNGGIDLTTKRWDTCKHSPEDDRRHADGTPYPPFHDVMAMVDGEAAQALAKIARERWLLATGEHLPPPMTSIDPWPKTIEPAITDVTVGISRTSPPVEERPAVREIEALYLDMIAAAKRHIYIENQYFTAHKLAEVLERRLAEPDGPEMVVVVRLLSHGWLEEHTMQALRTRLVARLRAADRWGRLRFYYPHVPGLKEGTCLDIHSKIMIVDDEWLRVGSANFSNRSMGMDTECDLTLEAGGDPRVAAAVRRFRNILIAEHLEVTPEEFDAAHVRCGSLNAAIASLQAEHRTLSVLEEEARPEIELSVATIADPEQPVSMDLLINEFSPDVKDETSPRSRFFMAGGLILLVAAMAAAWRYTPLADWLTVDNVAALADSFSAKAWAPLLVVLAYTPACFIMFPRPLITLFAVVAFGAGMGFVYAMSGILLAALVTYVAGRYIDRARVRRLAGPRLNRVSELLRQRGLVAMTMVRMVPVAPFAVVGIVAGAIRVKPFDFMLGTALGMLPGALTTTVFGDQIEAMLRDPSRINYWIVAGAVLAFGTLIYAGRRWYARVCG